MKKTNDELLAEFETLRSDLRIKYPETDDFNYYAELVLLYDDNRFQDQTSIKLKIIKEIQEALQKIPYNPIAEQYSPNPFLEFFDKEAKTPFCVEHVSLLITIFNERDFLSNDLGRSIAVRVINYLLLEMSRYAHKGSPVNMWLIQYQEKEKNSEETHP